MADANQRLLSLFAPASAPARATPRIEQTASASSTTSAADGALTVAQVAQLMRERLEGAGELCFVGEVSGFRGSPGAHWYFDVKDAAAKVSVVMFAGDNRRVRPLPTDGDLVVLRGRASFYAQGGRAQIIATSMQPVGAGALQARLEALRARLAAEGLFAVERKRALPALPQRVGIVTSLQSAAVRDVVKVIRARAPAMSVLIASTHVQGEVGGEIASAIEHLDEHGGCDVVLVVRGGGAREDLHAFNDERVVRAIVACRVPVVSGVGHETDVTLADHAADVRAATPSHAAELAVPQLEDVESRLASFERRLRSSTQGALERGTRRLAQLAARLPAPATLTRHHGVPLAALEQRLAQQSPRTRLAARERALDDLEKRLRTREPETHEARARLVDLSRRLDDALARRVADADGRLRRALDQLEALSPLAVLKRGWALATVDGRIARAVDVVPGARLRLRLDDADADVTVNHVRAPQRSP